ncbi:hypothetical protein [Methylomonas rivi]|uniref:Uncharacterized protein n=1 Tax=Methylomonas rivi TaxID=2952226 RepID=A0ABT1U4P1_9GAMM|nr:hypothetical protein [Methylomonas sp. WSC-6]MCQ8128576.1 hypothetical protein [Methylomonas sp. WSC-6]
MSIKNRLDKLEQRRTQKVSVTPCNLAPTLSLNAWMALFTPGFTGELTPEQVIECQQQKAWMKRHEH